MIDDTSKVVEIRPGRNIFCRHLLLSDGCSSDDGSITPIHLVCINGTAGSHRQYIPTLTELGRKIEQQQQQVNNELSSVEVHAWLYDAVGVGESPSPKPPTTTTTTTMSPYSDHEQVLDLDAFLQKFVWTNKWNGNVDNVDNNEGSPPASSEVQSINIGNNDHEKTKSNVYFIAHSYGPNWVYKWMKATLKSNEFLSSSSSSSTPSLSSAVPYVTQIIKGLILISTGVEDSKLLLNGGPPLFRYVPLWILKCLQPLLTEVFLKIGFSTFTHETNATLITNARIANNQNDMRIVREYYQSHDWISQTNLTKLFTDWTTITTTTTATIVTSSTSPTAATSTTTLDTSFTTTTTTNNSPLLKILVVHGVEDQVIPVEHGQKVVNALNNYYQTHQRQRQQTENDDNSPNEDYSLIVVENASHCIMEEQPDVLSHHIFQFIFGGDGGGGGSSECNPIK